MFKGLRYLFGWVLSALGSRKDLVLENLALREQLLARHTMRPRPRLSPRHKLFWDLLDRVIILNERHLKRLMAEYICYYHEDRTHLGLAKDTPAGRPVESRSRVSSTIHSMPRLGRTAPPLRPRSIIPVQRGRLAAPLPGGRCPSLILLIRANFSCSGFSPNQANDRAIAGRNALRNRGAKL